MSKKILISVIALIALFGATLPAVAQEAEEEEKEPVVVPNVVQVSDPPGDANFRRNDWQTGNVPIDGADLLSLWMSNDAETISANFQVPEAPDNSPLYYKLYLNPFTALDPSDGCIIFYGWVDTGVELSGDLVEVDDDCGEETKTTEGELSINEATDGSAIVTLTVPRSASPHFEEGSVLFTPLAEIRHHQTLGVARGGLTHGTIDDAKPGADYTLIGPAIAPPKKEEPAEEEEGEEPEEEPEEQPEEEEEPEQSEPPKKKGKKGASCAPWEPGEMGAEAETTVVTEKATEEAPIEVPIEAPPGLWPVSTGDAYHNVQVDTAGGEKGLFVRYEFPDYEDLDLYLYDAAGEEVAQAAGFNPAPYGDLNDTSGGGHSEMGAEQIDGFPSADCVGYTAELHSFLSEGGEYTLKLWLADPAEEEEE